MIGPFTAEAVLVDGYAAGLLVVARALDRLAGRVARPPGSGEESRLETPPWPHSEAGRFHRGIALALVVMAATLVIAEVVRRPDRTGIALAAATLAAAAVTGRRLAGRLRATPAGFPEPECQDK
ncbi:hypothetical protein JOL79_14775 [Microbispora sp. RL4-1S]|uniref:Uncharacterized protein n=1 Tax=Microbispora oryzae TaxID=2806554 RepID=A0A940WJI5_9ACTN|nr:hypothetical protein [Microbispora oryzae]MBP2705077.1 hypothetical protein [Microbispora oryzae]